MNVIDQNTEWRDGILTWKTLEAFYADTERFIARHGDVLCTSNNNREKIQQAIGSARIDIGAQPVPPEKPDMLKLIRMYVRANNGGLSYANSVLEIKAEIAQEVPTALLVCCDCGEHDCICAACPECDFIRYLKEDRDNPYEDYDGMFYQMGTNGHFFGCPIGGA